MWLTITTSEFSRTNYYHCNDHFCRLRLAQSFSLVVIIKFIINEPVDRRVNLLHTRAGYKHCAKSGPLSINTIFERLTSMHAKISYQLIMCMSLSLWCIFYIVAATRLLTYRHPYYILLLFLILHCPKSFLELQTIVHYSLCIFSTDLLIHQPSSVSIELSFSISLIISISVFLFLTQKVNVVTYFVFGSSSRSAELAGEPGC